MAELTEHTFFRFFAHLFCAPPEFAADELVDALEAALRRVTVLPADASPPLVDLARRALAALTRIRIARRLVSISGHVALEFRLRSDELQSRSREQRIAFARQLAMFSVPKDHRDGPGNGGGLRCVMAQLRTYPNHRNCGRCGKPVRQDSDCLRAHLCGGVVLFHWGCFVRQMRESEATREERKAS